MFSESSLIKNWHWLLCLLILFWNNLIYFKWSFTLSRSRHPIEMRSVSLEYTSLRWTKSKFIQIITLHFVDITEESSCIFLKKSTIRVYISLVFLLIRSSNKFGIISLFLLTIESCFICLKNTSLRFGIMFFSIEPRLISLVCFSIWINLNIILKINELIANRSSISWVLVLSIKELIDISVPFRFSIRLF